MTLQKEWLIERELRRRREGLRIVESTKQNRSLFSDGQISVGGLRRAALVIYSPKCKVTDGNKQMSRKNSDLNPFTWFVFGLWIVWMQISVVRLCEGLALTWRTINVYFFRGSGRSWLWDVRGCSGFGAKERLRPQSGGARWRVAHPLPFLLKRTIFKKSLWCLLLFYFYYILLLWSKLCTFLFFRSMYS